ncbi:nucleotide exchange factor GrpE [Aeromicrobium sp.]|uniref:nucleotide exchange factor GrpE n=1 Tax=Aeromicrobium sp. TaxID=1871063 RepID=UPI00351740FE
MSEHAHEGAGPPEGEHPTPEAAADDAAAPGGQPAGASEGVEPGEAVADGSGDELALARMEAEERTLDLQRVQAEYANYRRRVERDRELVRENATYAALTPIVEVLDTIDRAREHEPLEGGFKSVAEQLERTVAGLGLVKFGAPGDAFDPTLHEALSHLGTDPEVAVTTCKVVAKAGYKIGERVVRAAQVLVVDPEG